MEELSILDIVCRFLFRFPLCSKKRKARYTFCIRFDLNIDIINKEVIVNKEIERITRLVEENELS